MLNEQKNRQESANGDKKESIWRMLWEHIRSQGEVIGVTFLILWAVLLLVQFFLVILRGLRTESGLLGASFGLLSGGLGFIAIGMSAKSDRRHSELLMSLARDVRMLPTLMKDDLLSPSGRLLTKEIVSEQSKAAAQKRLDEDTKRVGFVRGEIYQLEDGRWGIHWGGKYPL